MKYIYLIRSLHGMKFVDHILLNCRSFIVALLFICPTIIKAQSVIPEVPVVIPPSPNAASLGKFGDVPVSLYTGIPNVTLPIYTVKVGKYTLPISLQYHSQGLKVEEIASLVGLNWSLNAGGVITRSVHGLPDENGSGGYWTHATWTKESIVAGGYENAKNFCNGAYEKQPDLFYFNFNGTSGKFLMDSTSNHLAHIIPYQNLYITHDATLSKFEIYDTNGVHYIFDVKETTTNDNVLPISNFTSAWYLSQIITPGGIINFTYQSETAYNYQSSQSNTIPTGPDSYPYEFPDNIANGGTTSVDARVLSQISTPFETITFNLGHSRLDTQTSSLDGITVKDKNGVLKHSFQLTHSYFGNTSSTDLNAVRLKFDALNELSTTNSNLFASTKLDYNDPADVPSTRSLSQDYWGFFNGYPNSTLLPYVDPLIYGEYAANRAPVYGNRNPVFLSSRVGTLKKITYPTGGTSEFIYEANDYGSVSGTDLNENTQVAEQCIATAKIASGVNQPSQTSTFTISTLQAVTVLVVGSYSSFPLENGPSLTINLINTDGTRTKKFGRVLLNSTETTYLSLSPGNYEAIASVDGNNQSASIKVSYYTAGAPVTLKTAGGVRIAQVINTDPVTGNQNSKSYSYKSDLDQTRSSGDLISAVNLFFGHSPIGNSENGDTRLVRTSYSNNYLGVTQGSHIGYWLVTETDLGSTSNGKQLYYYTSSKENPNTNIYTTAYAVSDYVAGTFVNYAKPFQYLTDYDFTRGLLQRHISYNAANQKIKDASSSYNFASGLTKQSANYFEVNVLIGQSIPLYTDKVSGIYNYYGNRFIETKIVVPWIYKTGSIETTYDYNGQNPITTTVQYYYDNPAHAQLTRTVVLDSKGRTQTSLTSYADDYAAGTPFIDNMKSAHQTGMAIEQVNYLNNGTTTNIISGNIVQYLPGGNGFIDKYLKLETITPILFSAYKFSSAATGQLPNPALPQIFSPDSHYKERISFNYDNTGNLLQATPTVGVSTSYKWGYNALYPTVEIKKASNIEFYYESYEESTAAGVATGIGHTGIKYTTIPTVSWTKPNSRDYVISYWYLTGGVWKYSGEQTYSGSSFTMTGGSAYDDVRIYPSDALMSTYTYDPLVGMTSSTDAKGGTTYYEYDTFQRLKDVKDKDRNIVKHTDYHYQGQ